MEQTQSDSKQHQSFRFQEPRRFKVVIYNDDFTTMDFVVRVLTEVFFKSAAEAEALMLQVHKSGWSDGDLSETGRWFKSAISGR